MPKTPSNKKQPKDNKEKNSLLNSIQLVDFSKKGSSKIKPNPYANMELLAELLFCRIFGYQKYHKKDYKFRDPKYFKGQIQKLIKKFKQDISNLQASELFISRAQLDLSMLEDYLLKQGEFTQDKQLAAIKSIALIATLLGYSAGTPNKEEEPYFIPSLWSEMRGWDNFGKYYKQKTFLENDARIQIIQDLVKQKYTKTEIALIMNQSGYKIAQYLNKVKVKKGQS